MKILVTGGCGFLGSHVCEYYIHKGDEVISFDNLTKHELTRTPYNVEGTRLFNWNILKGMGAVLIEGDVRNKEQLLAASKDCDYIIHTAAQPAMTIAIEEPELDADSNVIGTLNVLEAARKYKIPVVNCSSIHVYGNEINQTLIEGERRFFREPPTINENAPIMQGKLTPLHASKRAAEIYVQAYIDTYGLEAATFRLTGMYGPRQFGGEDHGWVANFVIRSLLKLPMKIFGTDKQVRDILYVSDAVKSFDCFYNNRKPGLYNIGGAETNIISIGECLKIIIETTGIEQEIIYEPMRHGDLHYFVCDIERAKSELKWEPEVSNEEGLKKLINWVEENINLFKGK